MLYFFPVITHWEEKIIKESKKINPQKTENKHKTNKSNIVVFMAVSFLIKERAAK